MKFNEDNVSELTRALCFHSYRKDMAFNTLSVVGQDIDRLRGLAFRNNFKGSDNSAMGWNTGIAIVNGKPLEYVRVGKYMVLIEEGQKPKMTIAQRWGMFISRIMKRVW